MNSHQPVYSVIRIKGTDRTVIADGMHAAKAESFALRCTMAERDPKVFYAVEPPAVTAS